MKRIRVLLLALMLPVGASAQDEIPPLVSDGFESLMADGPAAAVDTWTAAWRSEADLLKQAQLRNGFEQLWETIGPAEGHEIVTTRWLGTRVLNVYAVTFHETQPLFVFLRVYDSPTRWMTSWIEHHH